MPCRPPTTSRRTMRHYTTVLATLLLLTSSQHMPSPCLAAAAEHDASIVLEGGSDHNWERIAEIRAQAEAGDGIHDETVTILEEVQKLGTQHARRVDTHEINGNNSPNRGNVTASQTHIWIYPRKLLVEPPTGPTQGLPSNISDIAERSVDAPHQELRRDLESEISVRQTDMRTAYISINTCGQPVWASSGAQSGPPPQITLYVGLSGNKNPGPSSAGDQEVVELEEGFAATSIQAQDDINMAIAAPSLPSNFSGGWTYDIAVSIDDFYHSVNYSVPFLYLVDTDTTSALLVTDNLTQANSSDRVFQQWMDLTAPLPFTIFANTVADTRRMGLQQSFCGLDAIKQIEDVSQNATGRPFVRKDMITRGLGNKPKQQFLVGNLTRSTTYNANLVLIGNGVRSGRGVVRGGGTVWQPMTWTTKVDGNCQLLYNLPFCSEVAYAAPSNPQNYNITSLANLYDTYASQLYQNFSYSLQQVSCNATNDAKYSLARTCTDCARAYKQWLCAVTIPRCEDFSNNASYLRPRNVGQPFYQNNSMLADSILNTPYRPMTGAPTLEGSPIDQTYISAFATNQSRNPAIIDNKIAPGPYKEVLPCEDLCYSLVQSCPAALQFSCPQPGRGLEAGYGRRPESQTVIECSYLGAVYYIDDASRSAPQLLTILVLAAIIAWLNMV